MASDKRRVTADVGIARDEATSKGTWKESPKKGEREDLGHNTRITYQTDRKRARGKGAKKSRDPKVLAFAN
jgi:hypothetical protein